MLRGSSKILGLQLPAPTHLALHCEPLWRPHSRSGEGAPEPHLVWGTAVRAYICTLAAQLSLKGIFPALRQVWLRVVAVGGRAWHAHAACSVGCCSMV